MTAGENNLFMKVKIQQADLTGSVRSIDVEDNDRLIDKATVVFDDAFSEITALPQEGQTVLIDLGWGEQHAVIFEGLVARAPTMTQSVGGQNVSIIAYDKSFQMMRSNAQSDNPLIHNPKVRNHFGKISDILREIIRPYQIPEGQIRLDHDPSFTRAQPLRQVNLTDWQFIQDLALAYAGRAYVEYNNNRSEFYFQPESSLLQGEPMGRFRCCRGHSGLIDFNYQRAASQAAPTRLVASLNERGELVSSQEPAPAPPDPPNRPGTSSRPASGPGSGNGARIDQAIQATNPPPTSTGASQRRVEHIVGTPSDPDLPNRAALVDPTRRIGLSGTGRAAGTIQLRAKGKVVIEEIAPWAAGEWYVHVAKHIVSRTIHGREIRSNYETRFEASR